MKIEDLERKLKKKNEETADLKEKASVLTENEERVKRKCDQALSEADALRHQVPILLIVANVVDFLGNKYLFSISWSACWRSRRRRMMTITRRSATSANPFQDQYLL